MKNVLLIMDYAAPYQGNFILSISALVKHWESHGRMILVFPEKAKNLTWIKKLMHQYTIYFLPQAFYNRRISINAVKQLQKIVLREEIHVIHTHFFQANYNLYLYKKLYGYRLRYLISMHNHYISSGRLKILKDWVYKHTYDLYIGVSESVQQSAWPLGIPPDKTMAIRNAIDYTRLDTSSKIDYTDSGKYIYSVLMFGFPWHRKGVDIVASALNSLQNTYPIHLLIEQSGAIDQTKTALISRFGKLPDWITFLPPTERLADYYNNVDMFISAGREEGLCYSPIEAAYCNCDVMCSKIGGNPMDIPETGIYETEDVAALAAMLQERLSISAEKKELRKKTQRDYVIRTYDIDQWAEKVVSVY